MEAESLVKYFMEIPDCSSFSAALIATFTVAHSNNVISSPCLFISAGQEVLYKCLQVLLP